MAKASALSEVPRVSEREEPWLFFQEGLSKAVRDWGGHQSIICTALMEALWERATGSDWQWWEPWEEIRLPLPLLKKARRGAKILQELPLSRASFLVGALYTGQLDSTLRSAKGVFYTPPLIVERLTALLDKASLDWSRLSILDPACGGGAFLLGALEKILETDYFSSLSSEEKLIHLEENLIGQEIDPFAAWMAKAFLKMRVHSLSRGTSHQYSPQIRVCDALETALEEARPAFDLIIGNPPFGKVRLDQEKRKAFQRSLYGHANAYGLFFDAALRWRKPSGTMAFVAPTSFLGGKYFSRLRSLLAAEAPLNILEIFENRQGVFEQVQQEMCLALFRPGSQKKVTVSLLTTNDNTIKSERAGRFDLNNVPGEPWLLPRTKRQATLVQQARCMNARLQDLGYQACTGPLVWNRHKQALREDSGATDVLPLIWAEAVRANSFTFDYRARSRHPFVEVKPEQEHLVERSTCVLVQRTTAKEQRRRLIACALPLRFLRKWGGVVVENHVNVIRAIEPSQIPPECLAAFLNTETIDRLFRALSGTVSVSAAELHAIPLPDRGFFEELGEEFPTGPSNSSDLDRLEELVAREYGA